MTAVTFNHRCTRGLIPPHHLVKVFGIKLSRKAGGVHHLTHHDGMLPALRPGVVPNRVSRQRCAVRERRGCRGIPRPWRHSRGGHLQRELRRPPCCLSCGRGKGLREHGDLGHKPIALPVPRLNDGWRRGRRLDGFAQPGQTSRQGRLADKRLGPALLEQFRFRHHAVAVFQKIDQDLEDFGSRARRCVPCRTSRLAGSSV